MKGFTANSALRATRLRLRVDALVFIDIDLYALMLSLKYDPTYMHQMLRMPGTSHQVELIVADEKIVSVLGRIHTEGGG